VPHPCRLLPTGYRERQAPSTTSLWDPYESEGSAVYLPTKEGDDPPISFPDQRLSTGIEESADEAGSAVLSQKWTLLVIGQVGSIFQLQRAAAPGCTPPRTDGCPPVPDLAVLIRISIHSVDPHLQGAIDYCPGTGGRKCCDYPSTCHQLPLTGESDGLPEALLNMRSLARSF